MKNEQGFVTVPAAEDLRQAEAMLERERNKGPHPGKARMLTALESRVAILRKRVESEKK